MTSRHDLVVIGAGPGGYVATLSATTPCAFRPLRASWYSSLDSSSALLGMQPTRRHVPPSLGSFSTHATSSPSCAARSAAT